MGYKDLPPQAQPPEVTSQPSLLPHKTTRIAFEADDCGNQAPGWVLNTDAM
jgi:hypothetical protein